MKLHVTAVGALIALASAAEEEAAAAAPAIEIPASVDGAHFFEPFLASWEATWKVSKDADFSGTWRLEQYESSEGDDKGLVVSDPARKHAVSTLFPTPFDPAGKGLVIQYELQLKNTLMCGGAYLKLLSASKELSADGFKAETPYTIMFGPDKCGDTNKVHFILRHKNPLSGEWEEKHLVSPPVPETMDKLTHLYTAVVGTDNMVKILVDNVEKKSASLLSDTDFKPPINPPKEIDDPNDAKPADWVDDPKMDEPGAAKPDDWDEDAPKLIDDPKASKPSTWLDDAPEMIPDPKSEMPSDWDADEDGEWEAPLIKNPDCAKAGCGEWKAPQVTNPEYKGKWSPPKVDNPDYKGVWAPRKIANPHFFVDDAPHSMAPIGGIGIELWTMQNGILFDNILLTHDAASAAGLAEKTFVPRKAAMEAAKKEALRAESLKAEGFFGKIKAPALKLAYWVQDNPLPVGLAICLGLIPLLLYCCFGGGSKDGEEEDDGAAGAPTPPADLGGGAAADDEDDDEEDEGEEEEEEVEVHHEEDEEEEVVAHTEDEPEPPKKAEPKARKRTAKAKD